MKIRKSVPPKNIVYMDETWLNEGHHTKKEWTTLKTLHRKNLRSLKFDGLTLGCTKDPAGKGKCLIISNAMTEQGPVNGALWICPANSKKRNELQTKKVNLSLVVAQGTLKRKHRKKELRKNEDLKD